MRPLLVLIFCLLLVTACDRTADNPPPTAPGIEGIEDHWVVINYWASWCQPCREEIPELNELAQRLADDTQVFAVNFDRLRGEALAAEAAEMGIEFPLLERDPAPSLGYQRPTVLPTTVIASPGGRIHAILRGPQTVATLADAMGREVPDA